MVGPVDQLRDVADPGVGGAQHGEEDRHDRVDRAVLRHVQLVGVVGVATHRFVIAFSERAHRGREQGVRAGLVCRLRARRREGGDQFGGVRTEHQW